jgi:hypothetical protein
MSDALGYQNILTATPRRCCDAGFAAPAVCRPAAMKADVPAGPGATRGSSLEARRGPPMRSLDTSPRRYLCTNLTTRTTLPPRILAEIFDVLTVDVRAGEVGSECPARCKTALPSPERAGGGGSGSALIPTGIPPRTQLCS